MLKKQKSSRVNYIIKKNIIGTIEIMGEWLISPINDVVYSNPKFKILNKSPSQLEKAIAIYCIHGTADRLGSFIPLANKLLNHLPEPISTLNLISFNKRGPGVSIEDFAEQLKEKIKAKKEKNVILIGFSRGGLVSAYYTENLAKAAGVNVVAVISICSPYRGSYLATPFLSWLSTSIRQMEINSCFLKKLSEKIARSKNKYIYYGALNDEIVLPHHACIKEHEKELTVLDTYGHLSIMSSNQLAQDISEKLASTVV